MPPVRFVSHPEYDLSLFGIEKLHPFDTKKYSRALALTRDRLGDGLDELLVQVDREVSVEELRRVHSADYLKRLKKSWNIARILELAPVFLVPHRFVDRSMLYPMRLATRGTIMAAELAMQHGAAVNLAGGYHHAKPDSGEGFCVYNDIAIAIQCLRHEGRLQAEDTVLYIDLDAHQGNGVATVFRDDPAIRIFDMYGGDLTYPRDPDALQRVNYGRPQPRGTDGPSYLSALRDALPPFLEAHPNAKFCVYNAGTDIFAGDRLGGLQVDEAAMLARDVFVFDAMRDRGVPCVMVPSGGYTQDSHRLISNTLCHLAGANVHA